MILVTLIYNIGSLDSTVQNNLLTAFVFILMWFDYTFMVFLYNLINFLNIITFILRVMNEKVNHEVVRAVV